jgi:hypothetical protein
MQQWLYYNHSSQCGKRFIMCKCINSDNLVNLVILYCTWEEYAGTSLLNTHANVIHSQPVVRVNQPTITWLVISKDFWSLFGQMWTAHSGWFVINKLSWEFILTKLLWPVLKPRFQEPTCFYHTLPMAFLAWATHYSDWPVDFRIIPTALSK